MAPIRKPTVRKECRCSIYKSKTLRFDCVSVKTFKHHQEKDNHDITHVQMPHEDTCDTISSTVSEPVNQEEDSFEFEQEDVEMNSELRNLNDTNDILYIWTRNQPISETDCVFGPKDNVQYTSDTYKEEEEYEDESDVEMDNDEDSSLESILELNLIHQFIVISVALFVSLYVVDEGAVILIVIINKILQFLFDPFRLPVSVAGLKRLAEFEALTSGVKKYVACNECHAIYDNEAAPLCCTSPNFGKTSLCGNILFKSGPGSKAPKKTYYFDIVRCMIIDPMHNHLLGTAKRMLERWVADGLIDNKKFVAMQKAVEKVVLPPDYMSLGTKIAKGFPYMKADEWKSWCLVYSPVVLRDVLPLSEFKNWIEFVNVCRYFTKPSFSEEDIEKEHKCLEEFCKGCETLYNLDLLSPNMHLHLHLRQTMIDFGPVYGYWLFSFERNGFELTFMRQFIEELRKGDFVHRLLKPMHALACFEIFDKFTTNNNNTNTYLSHSFSISKYLEASQNLSMTIRGNEPLPPSALPLKTRPLPFMPKHEYDCLVGYYQAAYKNLQISGCKDVIDDSPFINDWIEMVKSVDLLGQSYKGCIGTNGHGSYIQAYFTERTELEHAPTVSSLTYRNPHSSQHVFAFVKWFKSTLDKTRELEGVELLQNEFYKQDFQSILPVHQIHLTVAIVDYKTTKNVNKKLAIPLPKQIYY
ncbi:hypothetical protein PHYBLDRAFT_173011 [Phycomyces blakesleeanus NRRL 1555(-)]|uniref:Uncharacterized protein n=1 Tax=Phycomyces blakesleeanus (strain ATCC 8743b / DSM 1359 / FGSC 10004 / NBRC 33097 / NRRL 1555) TaxID=763407 RepID=A0A167KPN9_PHYB8|nr:hypothetical protein PHYBLDRAFT_173011 [Phycomyces blakesleeanus NRRL 1555(-)]OAD68588.1 hypothetical protein PHYBLDRAFT_173011 [Phycomyces blakesleeanus NRRL 1555(-)]|eukprot:XP_018286628.1 hypothetical protein PHYBLDRAFT_173011 [Phycomyces blakesleeanus NRRL 1555(-)]